ncbi:MAG: CoA transferase [Gammaproteobacteria bacterium]|nr:CoA transferase [Gammaproteobacteria bacterium]
MSGPLSGLHVVELATAIQGPAAGLYFANMGANVIKVEPPMGDASRYHRGVNYTSAVGALGSQFVAMNKGKRSISLDVHTDLGAAVMDRLLSEADVFLSNYRASALVRMGLDVHALTEKYAQLVVGHVNGFGPLGPDADKAMLDGAAQARGGLASMSGHPGMTPTPPGVTVADHAGAMQLALACVTALFSRAQSGRGQLVQTSSLGAQLWLQMWELQHSFITNTPLTREGPHHPNIKAPYGVYMTQDGAPILFVVAMTDDAWSEFWIFADKPEAILLEEWDNTGKRIGMAGSDAGLPEIRELMIQAMGSKTMAEWETFLAAQPDIIWERVRDHSEVRDDPQNRANDYIVDMEVPVTGKTSTVGTLMAFSRTPTTAPDSLPALGEHTAEIMTSLGFAETEVESVREHAESARQAMFEAMLGQN